MNNEEFYGKLESNTGVKTIRDGKEQYIRPDDLVAVLRFAEENGVHVLGFEGFTAKDGLFVPLMNCIADFSSGEVTHGSIQNIVKDEAFKQADLIELVLSEKERLT